MFPGKQVCRCFFSHSSCTRPSLKTITAFPPEMLCSYRWGAPWETRGTPVYLWARLRIEKTVFFSISCTLVDILKTYSTGLPLFPWCSAGAETGLPSCLLENVIPSFSQLATWSQIYSLFSVSFHGSMFVICLFCLYRFVFLCVVFGFTPDFILFAPTWVCSVINLLLLDVYMFSFFPLSSSVCKVTLCVFTLQVFLGLFLLLFWVLALLSF